MRGVLSFIILSVCVGTYALSSQASTPEGRLSGDVTGQFHPGSGSFSGVLRSATGKETGFVHVYGITAGLRYARDKTFFVQGELMPRRAPSISAAVIPFVAEVRLSIIGDIDDDGRAKAQVSFDSVKLRKIIPY